MEKTMQTTTTRNGSFGTMTLVALVVAAALLTALLGFADPAKADQADRYPLHLSGGAWVHSGGTIQAKFPGVVVSWHGGLENVRWSPDLYR
jgi:hypothetical protein